MEPYLVIIHTMLLNLLIERRRNMHYFYIFMISLVNNFDNIGVRIAYSILGIKIKWEKNLWISVITFFISFAAAYGGNIVSNFVSKQISSDISAIILSAIGLWFIFTSNVKKNNIPASQDSENNLIRDILDDPAKADVDCSKDIDFKEATLLGIACSVNNIGGGLGAGMMRLNSVYVGAFSALISFAALWAGNYINVFFEKWNLGNKATILAGVALILIGIKQIL